MKKLASFITAEVLLQTLTLFALKFTRHSFVNGLWFSIHNLNIIFFLVQRFTVRSYLRGLEFVSQFTVRSSYHDLQIGSDLQFTS